MTKNARFLLNVVFEIVILAAIGAIAVSDKISPVIAHGCLVLNLIYIAIINLRVAKKGDQYICEKYIDLYNRFYKESAHYDWIYRPQFIAAILLFHKDTYESDIELLKKEARALLSLSMSVIAISLFIAIISGI